MKKTPGLDGFRRLVLPNIQESDNYNLTQIFPEKSEKRECSPTHSEANGTERPTGKDSMEKEN